MSELGAASAEVLAQLRYDLPASFAFHRCRQRRCQWNQTRTELLDASWIYAVVLQQACEFCMDNGCAFVLLVKLHRPTMCSMYASQ